MDDPRGCCGARREADGLALSSRNAYLDTRARKIAGSLNVIVRETAIAVAGGADVNDALAEGRAQAWNSFLEVTRRLLQA